MINHKIWPLALLALSQSVLAAEPISAGSQLQQIPPSPIPQKEVPKLSLVPSDVSTVSESDHVKIFVQRLRVTGSHAYSEADLVKLTGFKLGSELSLSELRIMAARITDYYHKNGYFVAQAYLPAQDINNGVVTITVIEGQYGKIHLRNKTNLSDRLINSQLEGIHSGDVVTIAPLENRLLLLSDIPGVHVASTLAPGASLGVSDLIVDVTPGARVTGSIDADNAGNRYTGENRIGATVNLNNLAGHGDVASLRVLTSGEGLNYARGSYQMQFGKATAGVAYSWLGYKLGKEFEPLRVNGDAKIASVYGSYPLIRSRNTNLYAQLLYEDKTFQDRIDSTFSVTDKKTHALTATLRGDHLDGFGGRGLTGYALSGTVGDLDIHTPEARTFDAMTAQTNGHYSKLNFSLTRLQSVTERVSLYAAFNGQLASKNLDVSEKMELGGMNAVRAYPEGEAYADQGYLMTVEARLQLPKVAEWQRGQMQLVGFVDTGTVLVNKDTWNASENRRTLSGVGVGINWVDYNNFMVRTAYARKLGSAKATSAPDRDGRFWIQAVKYF
jgi:hemolysin activation/secretion protein